MANYDGYTCEKFGKKYDQIQKKISVARLEGDAKKIKRAKRELDKWQDAYGGYAPIKCR